MTDLPPTDLSNKTPRPDAPRSDAPKPDAPRSGRGLRIALALSVALNLAFIGMAAGALLRGGPHDRMTRDLDFGPFAEAFSRDDRIELRRDFFERAGDMRQMRAALRDDLAGLIALLRADTLDRAELDRLLARQGARLAQRLELGQALVVERIAAMSPAERDAFANRLERALDRPSRDGRRD